MTAQEIKDLRLELGLSQSEFADRILTSIHTLRSWEQGHRNPKVAVIKAMQKLKEIGVK